MNDASENPYAPPKSETVRAKAAPLIPMPHQTLLAFDSLFMLLAAVGGGLMLVQGVMQLWDFRRFDGFFDHYLVIVLVSFLASALVFAMGVCGVLGDICLIFGIPWGIRWVKMRIVLMGFALAITACFTFVGWCMGGMATVELMGVLGICGILTCWWLMHWIVVHDVTRRIAAHRASFRDNLEAK